MHLSYTAHAGFLLPVRAYHYKKRSWHYFLFDLCYYCTILNFVYIWLLPGNAALFVACYCLSQGSLASAVITWRNSLVFYDFDKVTSLFIHIYAPLTFTVIRYVLRVVNFGFWLLARAFTLRSDEAHRSLIHVVRDSQALPPERDRAFPRTR